MRYFTNNPLERLMMRKPKAAREDSPPAAGKEHFCYGCTRFEQKLRSSLLTVTVKKNGGCPTASW
jgi:hypothetical protein